MLRQLTVLFASASLWSQTIPGSRVFPIPLELRQYLELSDPQVASLIDLATRFRTSQTIRQGRILEIGFEIRLETAKDTIDPNALGLRYREIELINREMEADRPKNRAEMVAVLTPAQRAKLTVLEQALLLRTTACAAVDLNLAALPPVRTIVELTDVLLSGLFALSPCSGSSAGILTGFFNAR